jgi:hypothetical protein
MIAKAFVKTNSNNVQLPVSFPQRIQFPLNSNTESITERNIKSGGITRQLPNTVPKQKLAALEIKEMKYLNILLDFLYAENFIYFHRLQTIKITVPNCEEYLSDTFKAARSSGSL